MRDRHENAVAPDVAGGWRGLWPQMSRHLMAEQVEIDPGRR